MTALPKLPQPRLAGSNILGEESRHTPTESSRLEESVDSFKTTETAGYKGFNSISVIPPCVQQVHAI